MIFELSGCRFRVHLKCTSWTNCASKIKYDHYSCILRCKCECVLCLVDCISSEMWCDCMLCLVELIASHLKCDMIMCYVWLVRCDCMLCLVGLIASYLKYNMIEYYVWLDWLHLIWNVMWLHLCQMKVYITFEMQMYTNIRMRVSNDPLINNLNIWPMTL